MHFTVSPGSSLNVALRAPTSRELAVRLAPSSQTMESSWKPAARRLSVEL